MDQTTNMSTKPTTRLVRESDFAAEVHVDLIEAEGGCTPYLSLDYAYRLDDVREALRSGDLQRASRLASQVYWLLPVPAYARLPSTARELSMRFSVGGSTAPARMASGARFLLQRARLPAS